MNNERVKLERWSPKLVRWLFYRIDLMTDIFSSVLLSHTVSLNLYFLAFDAGT